MSFSSERLPKKGSKQPDHNRRHTMPNLQSHMHLKVWSSKPHACTLLTLITNLTPKSQPMDPNHQFILCYVNTILAFERQPMSYCQCMNRDCRAMLRFGGGGGGHSDSILKGGAQDTFSYQLSKIFKIFGGGMCNPSPPPPLLCHP